MDILPCCERAAESADGARMIRMACSPEALMRYWLLGNASVLSLRAPALAARPHLARTVPLPRSSHSSMSAALVQRVAAATPQSSSGAPPPCSRPCQRRRCRRLPRFAGASFRCTHAALCCCSPAGARAPAPQRAAVQTAARRPVRCARSPRTLAVANAAAQSEAQKRWESQVGGGLQPCTRAALLSGCRPTHPCIATTGNTSSEHPVKTGALCTR